MDWDGVGTFALFISSGAVGVGLVFLKAYSLTLKSKLERERIRAGANTVDEVLDQVQTLNHQVERLTERVDFSERLLSSGQGAPQKSEGSE